MDIIDAHKLLDYLKDYLEGTNEKSNPPSIIVKINEDATPSFAITDISQFKKQGHIVLWVEPVEMSDE